MKVQSEKGVLTIPLSLVQYNRVGLSTPKGHYYKFFAFTRIENDDIISDLFFTTSINTHAMCVELAVVAILPGCILSMLWIFHWFFFLLETRSSVEIFVRVY